MNQEEYKRWEHDADNALSGRYTQAERATVLAWFRTIKGADERELVGNAEVDAMLVFVGAKGSFDLYNSLMARLFVYAPLILKEAHEDAQYRASRAAA